MEQNKLKRTSTGALINTDREALIKRRRDKKQFNRIAELEKRVERLEMLLKEREE